MKREKERDGEGERARWRGKRERCDGEIYDEEREGERERERDVMERERERERGKQAGCHQLIISQRCMNRLGLSNTLGGHTFSLAHKIVSKSSLPPGHTISACVGR